MSGLSAKKHGWVTAVDGATLHAIPQTSEEAAIKAALSSTDLVPMRLVAPTPHGAMPHKPFRVFLPAEKIEGPFKESSEQYSNNPFIDYEDEFVYLDDDWEWKEIEWKARRRQGHLNVESSTLT